MTPAAAAQDLLFCAHCSAPIPADRWNTDGAFCSTCRAPIAALVFPAFFAKAAPAPAAAAEDGEATCFYHPAKKAVVPCDQCGRFLCSLCQVEFQNQNWCPSCLENRRAKGKLQSLETRRTLYDTLALQLATLPAIWPFTGLTIIGAPMSLYVAIRYWNAPSSIIPRTRARLYIALGLSILEIAAWIWLAAFLIYQL